VTNWVSLPSRQSYRGYRQCRRRKRGTANAQRYEHRLLDHLVDTTRSLQDRSYAPSRSLCFVTRQPKAREIHAADFRDRVVHHVLVLRLEALFEPVFIHDLYSNRVGKGTHAAVARLAHFMRALNADGDRPGWFLQLDVRNFFNRIDQALLFGLINHRLGKAVRQGRISSAEARDLSWLTRVILKQDFRAQTVYRCSAAELRRVPEHKRLTSAPPGKGLPIGNLTSQFFANVYLNELDQFIKHQLKCRYYLRYVDDLILLDPEPGRLRDWRQAIARFLDERLHLALKAEPEPRPVTDGADFLGYIVRPDYRLVRRRVVGNLRLKLASFARDFVTATSLRLPPAARERLRAILASYLGHFAHADAWRLSQSLFAPPAWLGRLFDWRQGRLVPRWEPAAVTSLRSQVQYFRHQFPPALVLVQIGNRVALFEPDLGLALGACPWLARWRGAQVEARIGLGPGRSWPLTAIKGLGRSLRAAGLAYAFVAEEGYLRGGMKRRVLRFLYSPLATGPVRFQENAGRQA
jgi:RNA-directed DNA polymerase